MKRRSILAGAAAGLGATVAGGVTWLFSTNITSETKGDEQGPESQSDSTSTQNTENEDNENIGYETTPEGAAEKENETENESDLPEAANPESNPEGPVTNESVINESRATDEPSASDVVITETELITDSSGAAVTGIARNEAADSVTVELQVTFLENGTAIGRPALNGTTGLPAGETWEFTVTGRGSEYSGATDYEIEKSVQVTY